MTTTERLKAGLNGWWKVIAALVAGGVAYGTLKSEVTHNRDELETKADAAIEQLHYQTLRNDIADLKRVQQNDNAELKQMVRDLRQE